MAGLFGAVEDQAALLERTRGAAGESFGLSEHPTRELI